MKQPPPFMSAFSDSQIESFSDLYPKRTKWHVAEIFGIKPNQVTELAKFLGLTKGLSAAQIEQATLLFPDHSKKYIQEATGLSRNQLDRVAKANNLIRVKKVKKVVSDPKHARANSKKSKLLPEDLDRIIKMYPGHSNKYLAKVMGISLATLSRIAAKHGLCKAVRTPSVGRLVDFPPDDLEQIKILYPDHSNIEIARLMGITLDKVKGIAQVYRLRKSSAYFGGDGYKRIGAKAV